MARRLACVFGGSGFIGRHVVRRLAAKGFRVRVAVRDPEAGHFLKPMGDVGQVVPIRIDIGNKAAVNAAVAGAEIVINAVGILAERRRGDFTAIHATGAGHVAEAARAAGVQALVHLSALSASPDSNSHYGRSKAEGEDIVRAAFPAATILRPSIVVGPEDSFFNRFAGMTAFSPVLPVIGHGRFQPVYVGDVADAVIMAIDNPALQGRVFSLGGPQTYTLRELLAMMLAAMGRHRTLIRLPGPLASLLAMLPGVPLTLDQVGLLGDDNLVPSDAAGLAELGITPTALEAVLPTCLARFRDRYVQAFTA